MNQKKVEIGQTWRHKKRGTTYTVGLLGTLQISGNYNCYECGGQAADGEALVVYIGQDGRVWARPVVEFTDGRFELVEEVSDGR